MGMLPDCDSIQVYIYMGHVARLMVLYLLEPKSEKYIGI